MVSFGPIVSQISRNFVARRGSCLLAYDLLTGKMTSVIAWDTREEDVASYGNTRFHIDHHRSFRSSLKAMPFNVVVHVEI